VGPNADLDVVVNTEISATAETRSSVFRPVASHYTTSKRVSMVFSLSLSSFSCHIQQISCFG